MIEQIENETELVAIKMHLKPIRETNILDTEQILAAEPLLRSTIHEIKYSTLALVNDMIDLYEQTLEDNPDTTLNEFYKYYAPDSNRFNRKGEGNTCVGMCEDLKLKLINSGIKSFMIRYGSGLFDRVESNNYIESSHTALVVPFLNKDGKKYALFDPGLTIPKPIIFYRNQPSELVVAGNKVCKIEPAEDNGYTHALNIYDTSHIDINSHVETRNLSIAKRIRFNCDFEWKNQDETMIKKGYRCIEDMKTQSFDLQGKETAKLVIRLRTQKILIQIPNEKKIFKFSDIKNQNNPQFNYFLTMLSTNLMINEEVLKSSILRILKWEQDYKSQIWLPEIR